MRFFVSVIFVFGLVFFGIFTFLKFSKSRINDMASTKIALALAYVFQGDYENGFDLINKTALSFPKTSAVYQGKLIQADVLVDQCKYEEALRILIEISNNGIPDIIKPLASLRIIYIYDSQKDHFNAINATKEFINKYPDHFLVGDIYLNLGEYYVITGFKDDAINVFNDVLIKFPGTYEARTAQNRLNQLIK
ncbi:MAG: tetratricopeptide repeat protein [Endomicrobium sp.]|nr:tetratricopeptide repeat protein [Endomicrobium sp.]